jgi:Na+/proline symporter
VNLTALDFTVIGAYLAGMLLLGLWFRSRASRSTEEYFVSGRRAAWWLAGTSMVATTFAADTPLWVSGTVYTQGIAGNWLWWAFLPSGMMTVFLFARLWHRAGLVTDVEFAELRYAGRPAAFLRGFRAAYLGLVMNCLILGWVTRAMTSIIAVALGVGEWTALAICIFVLIPLTGVFVALGGLWGVLWTDLVQFVLMMAVIVVVAFYAVEAAGGMELMVERLAEARDASPGAGDPLAFFPDFSRGWTAEGLFLLPLLTFVMHLGVQWWASWYPGAEPGGGGYIAQRIFSARDERQGTLAVLWFNVAHYALRPWPWILTALAVVVVYPGLDRAGAEAAYVRIALEHLPPAWRGLLVAGMVAAFVSTVSTHLNWGTSYLVNDLYRRFFRRDRDERHYVVAARYITVLLVVITGFVAARLATVAAGWQTVLEIGAGTGAVYLLRWYWWRINAWSEISAMATAWTLSNVFGWMGWFAGADPLNFAKRVLAIVFTTTLVWVVVTFLTRPESDATLERFYRRARPDARGWSRIAAAAGDVPRTKDLGASLVNWLLGCTMVYTALFAVGKFCFAEWLAGGALLSVALLCGLLLARRL